MCLMHPTILSVSFRIGCHILLIHLFWFGIDFDFSFASLFSFAFFHLNQTVLFCSVLFCSVLFVFVFVFVFTFAFNSAIRLIVAVLSSFQKCSFLVWPVFPRSQACLRYPPASPGMGCFPDQTVCRSCQSRLQSTVSCWRFSP